MCRKIGFCVSTFNRKEHFDLLEQALLSNEYDVIYAVVMSYFVKRDYIDTIVSDIHDAYLKNIDCYKKGFQFVVGTTDTAFRIVDAIAEYETKPIVTLSGLECQIQNDDSIIIIRRMPDGINVMWSEYEREFIGSIFDTKYTIYYHEFKSSTDDEMYLVV